MLAKIAKLPLLVILMGISVLAMLVPAGFAWTVGEFYEGRVFLYGALLFGFITSFLAIAMADRPRSTRPRRHLIALLSLFVLLPIMLAVPFHQALRTTSFLNAYIEMVSALTTTGATLFDGAERLPASLHMWRALVGWLGGLFIWVGAIAVLAPMALGGFEVRARYGARGQAHGKTAGRFGAGHSQITRVADFSERIRTYGIRLLPVYTGLTIALWIGLILAGDSAFIALCHAMSTMSTSGISPVGGLEGAGSGYGGEVMIAAFLIFAISRLTFASDIQSSDLQGFRDDPEIRLAIAILALLPLFLFLRHWVGAYEVDEEFNILAGLASLWGSFFTTLSFLTTTGFESPAWAVSRDWSGLQTPGLILMGLALIGGGVATTAGGAKLMRIYALYSHGAREMEKLVHPSSVGGSGTEARHMRGRGAFMAWIFFMLMVLSIAVIMGALALTGLDFESAMILAIASLTTTGPIAQIAAVEPISYGALTDVAKLVLGGAMILGRLETLAIIALFSPDIWRR